MNSNPQIIQQTDCWLHNVVIKENLCPFAEAVVEQQQLHYAVSQATNNQNLHADIVAELHRLQTTAANIIATTLLIIPCMLNDFFEFNDQLNWIEQLLNEQDLVGEIQIATFHPHYHFSGTHSDDPSNYSNRSPYPMLHFIREAHLEEVLLHYPNPEIIPQRNIKHLEKLGLKHVQNQLKHCLKTP
ncbi:MAG: DUF1415 domain-containing protein [Gammaproteobacteria bacterium]|nr:DUF1415 domain-containing protein [Gammaproteobacteria bacterium]